MAPTGSRPVTGLLGALLIGLAVGCSPGSTATSAPTTGPTTEPTTGLSAESMAAATTDQPGDDKRATTVLAIENPQSSPTTESSVTSSSTSEDSTEPTGPTNTETPTSTPSSTTSRTSTSQPQPSAGPPGQDGDWTLVFNDDFSGASLDRSRWEPAWFASSGFTEPVNSIEVGCYHPNQVSVGGGSLALSATSTDDPNCQLKDGRRASYVSGLVNSRNSFTFTYGYLEARMYIPASGGLVSNWPAFWSAGANWPATGEIDVMEGLENGQPCWSYHWGSVANHRKQTRCIEGLITTSGWHTFAAHWEPGRITFYYDGQPVGTQTEGVVDDPHYLVMNLGLTDQRPVEVPSTVRVDWVRVWQER